jgi:hypothetical protein
MKKIATVHSEQRLGNSPHRKNTRLAAPRHRQVQFSLEAPMPGPVLCAMCDMPEERCSCEKYCTICKGQHNVRMGADGLYYCPDCREACDVPLANSRGR